MILWGVGLVAQYQHSHGKADPSYLPRKAYGLKPPLDSWTKDVAKDLSPRIKLVYCGAELFEASPNSNRVPNQRKELVTLKIWDSCVRHNPTSVEKL